MLKVYPTITVNNLVNYMNNQPDIFRNIPDFHFMIPLADKVKQKGCHCGLGGEFAAATTKFNDVVQNLNPQTIEILKKQLNTNQVCFGVQTQIKFDLKCY